MIRDSDTMIGFLEYLFAGDAVPAGRNRFTLDHMLQTAALAQKEGAEDSLVAAALLHDIGHYISDHGAEATRDGIDNEHEIVAATFLDPYFDTAVTEPIRLHVLAKRYLCAADPDYAKTLSKGSVRSLDVQGGAMTPAEVKKFESIPFAQDAASLRRWDDRGKDPNIVVPGFSHYRPILETLLRPARGVNNA